MSQQSQGQVLLSSMGDIQQLGASGTHVPCGLFRHGRIVPIPIRHGPLLLSDASFVSASLLSRPLCGARAHTHTSQCATSDTLRRSREVNR